MNSQDKDSRDRGNDIRNLEKKDHLTRILQLQSGSHVFIVVFGLFAKDEGTVSLRWLVGHVKARAEPVRQNCRRKAEWQPADWRVFMDYNIRSLLLG